MATLLTRGKVRAGLEAVILRSLSGLPDGDPIAEHELEALDQAIAREMDAAFNELEQAVPAYDDLDEDDMRRKSAQEGAID